MSVNIKAPTIREPRVSLVSSSEVVPAPSGDKWPGGIELYPLSGAATSGTYPICPAPSTPRDQENHISSQRFQPFAIYATDNCSTFSSGAVDFNQRVRDKLKVVESYWMEQALWDNPDSLANPFFTSATSTTVATGQNILTGFADLDSATANDLHDGRGMIHMTTKTFGRLMAADYSILRREGNVWYSPLDNIVVPGRGYSGDGPNATSATATVEWMFGHPGMVQIMRGDVDVTGLPANEMERAINHIWVTAQRPVAYVISNGSYVDTVPDPDENITGFYALSVDFTA